MNHAVPTHDAPGIDDMKSFDHVAKIVASDEDIRRAVDEADMPSLLAALAMLTQDFELIGDDLKPPTPAMTSTISPQGGMGPEALARARELATRKIIEYRDAGSPTPADPSSEVLDRVVRFVIKPDQDSCLPLLRHELNIPHDVGAPGWTLDAVAPGAEFKVAVIGAGVSGLAAAYRLQQAGLDYTVFEKNTEVGGVWWENTYPGCRLDTPNYAYSLSFAQKQDWPQQFSRQPEIQKYLASVSARGQLRPRIRFETEVISMVFDEPSALWVLTVRTAEGRIDVARFNAVITAVGILNRPSIPDFKGLDSFKGQVVHSAAWPKGLDLAGKRVALIGTGASAFQIGPAVVGEVKSLTVFQRNPPWMLPTPNYHDDIKPGMMWLLRHIPYYGRWFRFWQFWVAVEGRLPLVEAEPDWDHPVSVGRANEQLRQECVAALERQFAHRPDLLAKMTPNYPPGGKRMLRDNGVWGAMLQQPHVKLVSDGISHLTADGITSQDGESHPVDVIVCATGFKSSDFLHPIRIVGRAGRDLHAWWQGDCRAYVGITVPGFPNLFMTGGPNTAVVVNGSAIFSSECQVEYSIKAIKYLIDHQLGALDCKLAPFNAYNQYVDEGNLTKAWGVARTSSWYKNAAGRASQTWPFGLLDYWTLTSEVKFDDYEKLPTNRQSSEVRTSCPA
ncbi:flavin-containing monooxygenase [Hydrogenophaga laconesensis]|uniref:4-hydroxyacetophenone monooxygenase n=1 Tax=Hydrogenophaga laconesensis TaxID=1805971 RepID=A0ABU1VFD7_9BURK|nr:NAD(P)/FAD-dependent oxidoreductase [Hydrogenophaga laconesensis]MDR7096023.1 4-hydroxyacetophenone monooxygenase [Hydrogenophaga laconesensis]